MGAPRAWRRSSAVAVLVAALALALGVAPAIAARSYDSQITGFQSTRGIAIGPAGEVWVGNSTEVLGTHILSEYDAYPSQTFLQAPTGPPEWIQAGDASRPPSGGIELNALAVDASNGELFAPDSNEGRVSIFDSIGTLVEQWINVFAGINSNGLHLAFDNSGTASDGRLYLALTAPEHYVEVFNSEEEPVEFQATASYIEANKLTGTPAGKFARPVAVATGPGGEIFVVDQGKKVVDEFDSSGTFVRAITGAGAPSAFSGELSGVAVDPTNGEVLVVDETNKLVDEFDSSGNYLGRLTGADTPAGRLGGAGTSRNQLAGGLAVNSQGYLYLADSSDGVVDIFTPASALPKASYEPVSAPTATSGTLNATADPNGGGDISECHFEYGPTASYGTSVPCTAAPPYSAPTEVSAEASGLSTDTTYHYRVVLLGPGGTGYGADQTYPPHRVLGLSTEAPSGLGATAATLQGSFVGNGEDTHYYFEWGTTAAYGNKTAPSPGQDAGSPPGPARTPLSFALTGLTPYTTYHYRVVASNGNGTARGEDRSFTTPPAAPAVKELSASAVHADAASVQGMLDSNGAQTKYRFEYVDQADFDADGYADAARAPATDAELSPRKTYQGVATSLAGLSPATTYHYRIAATNSVGSLIGGPEKTFTTLPFTAKIEDPCANAHVRQQTGAASLLDCRAYELVSAANTAGYDVESNLIAGQEPFASYPEAESPPRVLYGVHNGGIPGTGDPTNRGLDPYVATRGENGWSTSYVGIPADDPFSSAPFSSPLLGADSSLDTFAFGGEGICSPCFEGATGIPLRTSDGSLIQGMAGSEAPEDPQPDGLIAKPLSANGEHLIFGSTQKFAEGGNEESGDVSIYDRNLKTGQTHVVSNTPEGEGFPEALPCLQGEGNCHSPTDKAGIAELDVSSNGSRILLGQKVSTDAKGNDYFHLYMDIGDSIRSIDLTPNATDGVLFDGMTSDGSKVFFTTKDQLTTEANQDEDESADVYMAEAGTSGPVVLKRISTGTEGTGNSDSCDPAPNSANEHWNSLGSANCDAVAIGGGGGVASSEGSVYFFSPELLDGSSNGTPNAPNLYIARPEAGYAPRYVTTLESSLSGPQPPPLSRAFSKSFGNFNNATGLAVDHQSGDLYLLDAGANKVQKLDSAGNVVSSFGDTTPTHNGLLAGKETPAHSFTEAAILHLPTQLAVDNDPTSASYGDLYVPDFTHKALDKFDSSGGYLSQISLAASPSGVAVDQADGDVYVSSSTTSTVYAFSSSGEALSSFPVLSGATAVGVGSDGNVYVANGTEADVYSGAGELLRTLDPNASKSLAVDPSNGDVYVDEGTQVARYDSAGNRLEALGSAGALSGSIGVAIDARGSLYATNAAGKSIAAFPASLVPAAAIDSPTVLDAVDHANTRKSADFQVSADGAYAAFGSTLALAGDEEETAGHAVLYRYNAPTERLDCVSCTPTGEPSKGDASLATDGLSLTNDGRVFFTSSDQLAAADTDGKKDAYEWEDGKTALVSAGTSPFDSGLLGASANGKDAYFFTRDSLAPQDQNGPTMKLYDAREGGGFPYTNPAVQCQASDECHGAASAAPGPVGVGSLAGTPGNGEVAKRHHKKKQRHHNKRHHKRAAHKRGGAK